MIKILILPAVRLSVRPQLLSAERDRRHTTRLVNCCQRIATVLNCC